MAHVTKNNNPGPDRYNPTRPQSQMQIHINKTMGNPEPPKPLPDNGVPGPGNYVNESNAAIKSYKIMNDTLANDK